MVVLAGVAQKDGNVFIARRLENKSNGGLWEFPGGKLERDESDAQGLIREFHEEFSVEITVGEYLGDYPFSSGDVSFILRVYHVAIVSGDFSLVDHSEVKWVPIEVLSDYSFSPADIPVVRDLVNSIQ